MITFSHWLNEESQQNNEGPEMKWQNLIELHRVQFNSAFVEKNLQTADKAFVTAFFDNFKYSKQLPSYNVFETKIRGCIFKIGYFKNQKWAASIETDKGREVTEMFQVTETKIAPLYDMFNKAIKRRTFKDILPVVKK